MQMVGEKETRAGRDFQSRQRRHARTDFVRSLLRQLYDIVQTLDCYIRPSSIACGVNASSNSCYAQGDPRTQLCNTNAIATGYSSVKSMIKKVASSQGIHSTPWSPPSPPPQWQSGEQPGKGGSRPNGFDHHQTRSQSCRYRLQKPCRR